MTPKSLPDAEFNRFGLARQTVIVEIVGYLREAGATAEAEIKAEMANQAAGEVDPVSTVNPKPEHTSASHLIRRLAEDF